MATETYHESRKSQIYGVTVSLVVAATFAVALRLVARIFSAAKYWWDDWMLVLALIFNYGLNVCFWLQVTHAGLGRHTIASGGPVTEKQVELYFKIFLPVQILYFASAVAIKTSLILLYYRLFSVTRWLRWELAFAWILVLFYFIVNVLVAIFECKPISYLWDKSIPGGTCINQDQFFRWNGVANLLIDFMILTLTMPIIWHLQLKSRQKISLTVVFLLGLFACVASIVRVITFSQIILTDFTYTAFSTSMWSTIEQSIGIICACLITYQPLVSRLLSFINNESSPSSDNRHRDSSKVYELGHSLKMRSTIMNLSSNNASTAGFARLDEIAGMESFVTTHVSTTAESGRFMGAPEAILKNHTIEQHHDHLSGF